MSEELRRRTEEWEHGPMQQALDRKKERRERFETESGIEVKPLYTPLDLGETGVDYLNDVGFPGEYPFTRGRNPLGYRQSLWLFSQYAGYGSAEEANKRYRFILDKGSTAVSIAMDLPTQLGYDSDHPMAEGEVGKTGVPIDSLQDIEAIFEGIRIDRLHQVSTTANAIPSIFLAMMVVLAEKQGVSPQDIRLRIQNDILKEYISRATYIFPPKPSVKIATDVVVECAEKYPNSYPMCVSGYHMREAGATAAQEIAFTMALAITYADDIIAKGVAPEKFLPKLAVHLSCNMDFFEEIAKFRAMRRLWARTFRQRYSISDPNILGFYNQLGTAGSALTSQQPMNNIIRTTIQSLASVLGGCESLLPKCMDEAYALPSEQAVKLALRTEQIIGEETRVDQTVDPMAGSYFVEYLTTKLESMATEYLQRVEKMGGAIPAIEKGYFQREISKAAYKAKREIEEGKRVIVGVNQYVDKEELPIELLKVAPEFEKKQKEKLKKLRSERNNLEVRGTLKELRRAAEDGESLIPSLLRTVRAYATVGEMCDILKEVYGGYTAPSYF